MVVPRWRIGYGLILRLTPREIRGQVLNVNPPPPHTHTSVARVSQLVSRAERAREMDEGAET